MEGEGIININNFLFFIEEMEKSDINKNIIV